MRVSNFTQTCPVCGISSLNEDRFIVECLAHGEACEVYRELNFLTVALRARTKSPHESVIPLYVEILFFFFFYFYPPFLLPGAEHLSVLFYPNLLARDCFITERKVMYKSENVKEHETGHLQQ
jgi:hypothetical protein